MAEMHRKFRTNLTKHINAGTTPNLGKLEITQQEWDAFVESRQSDKFKVYFFFNYNQPINLIVSLFKYFHKANCFFVQIVGSKSKGEGELVQEQIYCVLRIQRL